VLASHPFSLLYPPFFPFNICVSTCLVTLGNALIFAQNRDAHVSGLDLNGGSEQGAAYRVLARKYRPQDFSALIGQEPMVRTLKNAFETGRIAQAWMLTGVRGVGKTTTARILARALNYQSPIINQPTVDLSIEGIHCRAIMEGRHPDIIEMDAASNTGIDNIREIIEQVRYRPVSARFKVYIIDEVHMLSTQAFNGLLKTLEEPPAHVKFIFATTEIRKVPITVLSRCQRFDLRRVEAGVLVTHLAKIAALENVSVDDASLAMIARAAEGSVRDSLSIMDQAIAHGSGTVEAETVRSMLGLADRSRIVDLYRRIMEGDAAAVLTDFRDQYDQGADPLMVLNDLAQFCHLITRMRYVPALADDLSLTEDERASGKEFAEKISMRVLSRTWQMLLKAIEETAQSNRPIQAAEMALIRLCYASTLPTLDEALKAIEEAPSAPAPRNTGAPSTNGGTTDARASFTAGSNGQGGATMRLVSEPTERPAAFIAPPVVEIPTVPVTSLADILKLADQRRDVQMKVQIRRCVRMGTIRPGVLEIGLTQDAPRGFATELSRKLTDWTGQRWMVSISPNATGQTVEEAEGAKRDGLVTDAKADPDVAAILARFPGSKIINVKIETAALPEIADDGLDAPAPPAPIENDDDDDL
jgi:DNA polymerase III subunit gamma/tau